MKSKLFIVASVFIALTSCTQVNMSDDIETEDMELNHQKPSSIRSFDEALQIAEASISVVDGNKKTRSLKSRRIDLSKSKVCKSENTRSDENSIDTLLYVFNFEDNLGFSIVSASRSTNGLLAVTEKGNYDPEQGSEIGGFNMFIDLAKEYVLNSLEFDPVILYRDSVVYVNQYRGPFVTVNWGQEYTEGEYFPNGIAGCWNIALAQVMSYYEYPTSINLTYPGADVTTQALNWSQLKAHDTEHYLSSCSSQDTHKATSRFVRQLGYMNGSYSVTGSVSGTAVDNLHIGDTVQVLGYQWNNEPVFSVENFRSQLDSHRLIIMTGGSYALFAGHVWVLDGYARTGTITYVLERVAANLDEWVVSGSIDETTTMWHFNWGWYGDCNGYFEAGVYNTHAATYYDNNHHPQNYNFSEELGAFLMYR